MSSMLLSAVIYDLEVHTRFVGSFELSIEVESRDILFQPPAGQGQAYIY